jgi:thiol:disulfide interchange protein
MMKKSIVALILIAIAGFSFTFVNNMPKEGNTLSSELEALPAKTGIKFQKISLSEAKGLAKKSNKIVFIDCYTTWCGPCKVLDSKVFSQDKVGNLFNNKFINIKLDMENDPDGKKVAASYRVNSYPTLLFIDKDGTLKKRSIGFKTAEELIGIANSI